MKCLGNAMFLSINNIATFNQNNISFYPTFST